MLVPTSLRWRDFLSVHQVFYPEHSIAQGALANGQKELAIGRKI
jgi:hypothetical protein